MNRKDLILYISLIIMCLLSGIALSAAGYGKYGGNRAAKAGMLAVYVDGSLYGTFDLYTEQEIVIDAYGGTSNTVHIENGSVSMAAADCRNQLCVRHAPIRYGGEEIICLPDRVVLRLIRQDDKEGYDALSR